MPDNPATGDPQELLTVEQVSHELQVHQATVRDWINRGLLPAFKPGRRAWRVRRQVLEEFAARSRPRERREAAPLEDPYTPRTHYAAGLIDTLSARSQR
jgi:excisionase family DNA binding protein